MNHLAIIKEKIKNDNYANNFGIILDDLKDDYVKMHMELRPIMNNFYDRPHGAAIYGLADVAFSVIGNNQNIISVALECSITYHSSPDSGQILYVEGKLIKQSRKIGTYLFTLYTMDNNKQNIVATMLSTLYRTNRPIEQNRND